MYDSSMTFRWIRHRTQCPQAAELPLFRMATVCLGKRVDEGGAQPVAFTIRRYVEMLRNWAIKLGACAMRRSFQNVSKPHGMLHHAASFHGMNKPCPDEVSRTTEMLKHLTMGMKKGRPRKLPRVLKLVFVCRVQAESHFHCHKQQT